MAKSIEQKFRKLTEVEHVLARPGRYIGSIKPHTSEEWVPLESGSKMGKKELTFNPGFIKLFDEIISNSADEAKRPGSKLDTIRVDVDQKTGEITVYDNGGIPVVKHKEYDQYIPEMIFELRAGSNFDDNEEATLTGQNGEGAALTCIFSTKFRVETCDGKNKFLMTFTDNSQGGRNPKVSPVESGSKGYTKISYLPDFEKLGMSNLDDDNLTMLHNRVIEVAATNTSLKVYFNGARIMTKSFKDYIEMFLDDEGEYAFDDGESFKVGVAKSDDGFQHTSFVNTSKTKIGGTHIHYIVNQIVEGLRAHIEKKAKVVVKPADIRNHLHLFVDATIVNPRYSSQTKDELITEPSAYGRGWSCPDKLIQKLLKTSIIQSVLDWVSAKQAAEELKALKDANKDLGKADARKVDKFSDASERNQRIKCILFLSEGDSASKSIQGGRGDNPYIGSFPLKGKPANVREKDVLKILGLDKAKTKARIDKKDNKVPMNEIQKILAIIGLKIGTKVNSLDELRFGKIAFASDADVDGFHICGLLMNMFDHFWPELFELGFIHILRTPVIVVTLKDKSQLEFFTERDYKTWEAKDGQKLRGWSMKYYKGLSTWSTKHFGHFLSNLDQYLFRVDLVDSSDKEAIDLAFNSQRADDRKVWLETPADDFDKFIVRA